MSFSKISSAQPDVLGGAIISIETDLARGLHAFTIVGLPDRAIEEASDRVASALKNSGFESPKSKNEKVVISLSPADLKKEGSLFDVPIALGYLLASGLIEFEPEGKLFIGELGLDGAIRPVRGVLPVAQAAKEYGFKELYVPEQNAREAALVSGIDIFAIATLSELIAHLEKKQVIEKQVKTIPEIISKHEIGFAEIKGQEAAKRALMIAAAGAHNIALFGPPGTGKTMLARALASILPPLGEQEMLEVTSIHSVSGILENEVIATAPFRAPHHSASYVAVIGGGSTPKPGEVTLAHHGVLFLDEFPEFDKRVLESLRQPLEDRVVTVARAKGTVTYPSSFILIAALNPCPCGYRGSDVKPCTCGAHDIARYERKLSGPIIDRIDLWVHVPTVSYETLSGKETSGNSVDAKQIVIEARKIAEKRNANQKANALLSAAELEAASRITDSAKILLNQSAKRLLLSARSYHKVLKLARTIADMDNSDEVIENHILEALQYRPKK